MNTEKYQDIEKRLYRLPILISRIQNNKNELKELRSDDFDLAKLRTSSKSFVSLIRPGMRITPMEAHQAQIDVLCQRILADEREVRTMKRALKRLRNDPYYMSIDFKYFKHINDEEAMQKLACSLSTLRRNRSRLVTELVFMLYGVEG